MAYKDLRDWLEQVEKTGELTRLSGVDWDIEVGAISAMTNKAVLFDDFAGYPKGYRILSNMIRTVPRWLSSLNWSTDLRRNDLVRAFKERLYEFKPVPPKLVQSGPILENIQEGEDIDVLKFPVPKIHPEDAGRYIGSACALTTRDPDTGRVNMGVYRSQVHDKKTLGIHMSQGKDGDLIMKKYHARGEPCPVVLLVGLEPTILNAASLHFTNERGYSEYDFAGWLKGEPIDVMEGKFTGLPIPARTEIAIEGEIPPGVTMLEGSFGEWTGYSEPRQDAVINIKRVLHRNDPILTVQSPSSRSRKPETLRSEGPRRAGLIWQQMELAGIREIKGVATYSRFLVVVSIKNSYGGHSKQAGYVATQCHGGGYLGKFTIVVDEDIDPHNIDQVMWAVIRRTDLKRSPDVLRYCWSSAMDCGLSIEDRGFVSGQPVYNSRCIIDACIPLEWGGLEFKAPIEYSPETKEQVRKKYGDILFPAGETEAATA